MSLVDDALNLGGTLSQSVDLRTGEIVSARVPPAQGRTERKRRRACLHAIIHRKLFYTVVRLIFR